MNPIIPGGTNCEFTENEMVLIGGITPCTGASIPLKATTTSDIGVKLEKFPKDLKTTVAFSSNQSPSNIAEEDPPSVTEVVCLKFLQKNIHQ